MYTWSDEVNPNVETGDEMVTSVSEDKLKVYKIGEDLHYLHQEKIKTETIS